MWVWYLAVCCGCILGAPGSTTVHTRYGIVEGYATPKTRNFKAIPYAAPPVGANRWQPPEPPISWKGVRNATSYGSTCTQSEDCLFLNVFVPLDTPPSPLPVMVWIHGGCYFLGSGEAGGTGGTADVGMEGNFIMVTLNYRLGAMGFLASPAIRNHTKDGSAGNFGIQDQRAALQWVKDVIPAFGGDPTRVTIFGESAGAGSVATQLVTTRSWPLFHGAVIESGGFAAWDSIPFDGATKVYDEIQHKLKCTDLDCMKGKTFEEVHKAQSHVQAGCKFRLQFSAVIDGVELTDDVYKLAEEGKHAKVPLLIGTNRDEGTLFARVFPGCTEAQYHAYMTLEYGEHAATVEQLYPPSQYPKDKYWWSAVRAWTDYQMRCPARRGARAFSKAGLPTWVYIFTHPTSPSTMVSHATELPYVFHELLELKTDPAAPALSVSFVEYWTQFARKGDPNIAGQAAWPTYNQTADVALRLDTPTPTPWAHQHSKQCDFFDTVIPYSCEAPGKWLPPCYDLS